MAGKIRLFAVLCDFCKCEAATSYCETCQTKLCKLCHASHARQYKAKAHILTNIEKVKLPKLNITCTNCKEQATKCCHDCNTRLCTICASVHHQLRDITGTTQQQFGDALGYKESRTTHDIKDTDKSSDWIDMSCKESTQPTSASAKDVAQNAVQIKPNCVCGLCGVEAVDFCKNCNKNLCEMCKETHKKQKDTKHNNLREYENSKPLIRKITCDFCAEIATKVCPECGIRFCSNCCHAHHKLSDTLMLIGHATQKRSDIRFFEEITVNSVLLTGDDAERIKSDDKNEQTKEEIGAIPKVHSIVKSTFATPSDNNLKKENRPGKPKVERVYVDSVDIVWKGMKRFCQGDHYQVHIKNSQSGVEEFRNFTITSGKVEGLQPNSSYIFKVCMVMANGETSQCSNNSAQVTTHIPFASKLVHQSRLLEESGGLSLYAVPMTELTTGRNEIARTRKFDIGSRRIFQQIEHTIMLVGATGTGKTTLVDTLTNYILGVTKEDPFRFTVKQEEDREKEKDQAISQTDWITCYSFNPKKGMRFPKRINIIDTPGFGDTCGIDKDREHFKQISQLFNEHGDKGIQTIDAVCFIVKAPDSRLTGAQQYVFNGLLSMFGKDVEKNILTLITFCDGTTPQVLAALKKSKLPDSNEYNFNNSVLFSAPNTNPFTTFWEMNFKSTDALFCHLNTTQPQSLQLTREVLNERFILDLTRKALHKKINAGLLTIRELEKQIQIFKENKVEIEKNQNFTYSVREIKPKLLDLPVGKRATNCNVCKVTCHEDCSPLLESFARSCRVMNWISGDCKLCLCPWTKHETTNNRFTSVEVTVKKTYKQMKRKYMDAKGKMPTLEQVILRINKESKEHEAHINEMVNTMKNCTNRLKEIALQPDCLGFTEQIDQMIYDENNESREGFQDRVEQLKKYRDKVNVPEILRQLKETRDTLETGSGLHKKRSRMMSRFRFLFFE